MGDSGFWRLSDLMAERGMKETSRLRPLLAAQGVELSREQVFRLVKNPPERLSVATLFALCRILECTPNDLLSVAYEASAGLRPRDARKKPKSRLSLDALEVTIS